MNAQIRLEHPRKLNPLYRLPFSSLPSDRQTPNRSFVSVLLHTPTTTPRIRSISRAAIIKRKNQGAPEPSTTRLARHIDVRHCHADAPPLPIVLGDQVTPAIGMALVRRPFSGTHPTEGTAPQFSSKPRHRFSRGSHLLSSLARFAWRIVTWPFRAPALPNAQDSVSPCRRTPPRGEQILHFWAQTGRLDEPLGVRGFHVVSSVGDSSKFSITTPSPRYGEARRTTHRLSPCPEAIPPPPKKAPGHRLVIDAFKNPKKPTRRPRPRGGG
ncbi:MAG: hypothetical protein Ct9H300mP7_1110 [Verrucomicrobiota bacterium]|nr:MAG: hypothetical protein Ct9H300mP7_1110 [Verrucomicrobiota bacterium]